MIAYNITYKVDPAIEEVWIEWQQQQHIPEILATGLFTEYKMFRLLEQDDSEGMTFVIQFFAPALENYYRYIEEFAAVFSKRAFDIWGDRFIAFRTVMEVVN